MDQAALIQKRFDRTINHANTFAACAFISAFMGSLEICEWCTIVCDVLSLMFIVVGFFFLVKGLLIYYEFLKIDFGAEETQRGPVGTTDGNENPSNLPITANDAETGDDKERYFTEV